MVALEAGRACILFLFSSPFPPHRGEVSFKLDNAAGTGVNIRRLSNLELTSPAVSLGATSSTSSSWSFSSSLGSNGNSRRLFAVQVVKTKVGERCEILSENGRNAGEFLTAGGKIPGKSGGEQLDEESCGRYPYSCEIHTVNASLGSSVLFPCNFTTNYLGWVSWNKTPGIELVQLKSDGRVRFLLPKGGRVKTFPNQGSRGNYSIRIDELEDSDLGRYFCVQGHICHQVELGAAADTMREGIWLLIYVCAGVAAVVLLSVCSYWFYKEKTQENTNPIIWLVNVEENDDQDPAQQVDPSRDHSSPPGAPPFVAVTTPPAQSDVNQQNFERTDGRRKKLSFHRELLHRLRPASHSRQYYVNQGEINRQQHAMSAQAVNDHTDHEYRNPIYNKSTVHLNHL
ncbi:uncharacterized protein LOC118299297 isoform X2 [Scophthalmus maximus]|uniref:uncharacterized protein LOC118299297 isoform X2 n=1 Tax=Scophthalmus maximus TaxID=52904 RepID=UPI001FA8D020|nr:uncharacterized protein LOC118299297 isoform X2 [Scophthalmus maximus]